MTTRKIISFLLALILVSALLPTQVFAMQIFVKALTDKTVTAQGNTNFDGENPVPYVAAGNDSHKWIKAAKSVTTYPLWVGGVQFTSVNLTIDTEDSADVASGSAVYDPDTNILTLTDFQYSGAGYEYLYSPGTVNERSHAAGIFYDGDEALTVDLSGDNAVTVVTTDDKDYSEGFCSNGFNIAVTFTGTGSLRATGGQAFKKNSYGIDVAGALTVGSGTTVTGVGGSSYLNSVGVDAAYYDVYGSLTGIGSMSETLASYGIFCSSPTDSRVTVYGGVVNAAAGSGYWSIGVNAHNIDIRGGALTASSAATSNSCALYYPYTVQTGVSARGSVNADGAGAVTYDTQQNDSFLWFHAEKPLTTYPLWVGGVQVTSANKDDITAAITAAGGTASGTATYDPDSATLALTNANITSTSYNTYSGGTTHQYVIYADGLDLTVSLSGSNTIGPAAYTITSDKGSLTITGGGSLTASSSAIALWAGNDITITGSTVTATAITYDGIFARGSVTITDSTVTATGGRYGIVATVLWDGVLTVSGEGSVVTLEGGEQVISANNVTFNDGLGYIEGSADACKAVIAEIPVYPLWVGGVQFTSVNLTIDTEDSADVASGSAVYDPDTNTLTLTDFQYSGAGYEYLYSPGTVNESSHAIGIFYDGDEALTVDLSGDNAVTVVTTDAKDYSEGFCSNGFNIAVTFTGTGSLRATGGPSKENSYGIAVIGALTVGSGTTVTGVGGRSCQNSVGVDALYYDVYGSLTGIGGMSETHTSYGIFCSSPTDPRVTVYDGGVVNAAAGSGYRSFGVIADNIDIRGGALTASSGTATSKSCALLYPYTVQTGISARGSVNADGAGAVTYDTQQNDSFLWFHAEKPTIFSVVITSGANMTKEADSGAAEQTVTAGDAMESVVYTAGDRYYFPTNYEVAAVNGITVTRDSWTQITVSGTPTADAEIVLADPEEKPLEITRIIEEKEVPTEIYSGDTLDAKDLEKLAREKARLSLISENGLRAEFDSEALAAIAAEANGEIRFTFENVSDEYENEYPGRSVYRLRLISGGREISGSGGNVEITVPYTPGENESIRRTALMTKDGDTLRMVDAVYDEETRSFTATVGGECGIFVIGDKGFPFTDVKKEDYFYDAVDWADIRGVTHGKTSELFAPTDTANRAEVICFLWRAEGCPEPALTENPFTDISESDYFYKAVLWAVEKGVTVGTENGLFKPYDSIQRAHVVTFLYRLKGVKTDCEIPFTDVPKGSYFYDAVCWAYKNGVTLGISDTLFGPFDFCLRCQIVTILYRSYK